MAIIAMLHVHGAASRTLISLFCPGMVLLSLIFSIGAVAQLAGLSEKVHQVVKYTWMAGLPFQITERSASPFLPPILDF